MRTEATMEELKKLYESASEIRAMGIAVGYGNHRDIGG